MYGLAASAGAKIGGAVGIAVAAAALWWYIGYLQDSKAWAEAELDRRTAQLSLQERAAEMSFKVGVEHARVRQAITERDRKAEQEIRNAASPISELPPECVDPCLTWYSPISLDRKLWLRERAERGGAEPAE